MGVLESKQGSGTVVSAGGSPLAEDAKDKIIRERIQGLLAEATQLGYTVDDVARMMRDDASAWLEEKE
jgi:DNA-binding transcriptional regulator YhcF (GntR family)